MKVQVTTQELEALCALRNQRPFQVFVELLKRESAAFLEDVRTAHDMRAVGAAVGASDALAEVLKTISGCEEALTRAQKRTR